MALLEVPGQSCHTKVLLAELERQALIDTGLVEEMQASGQLQQLAFKAEVEVSQAIEVLLSIVPDEQRLRLQKRFGWRDELCKTQPDRVGMKQEVPLERCADSLEATTGEVGASATLEVKERLPASKRELFAKALACGVATKAKLWRMSVASLQEALQRHAAPKTSVDLCTASKKMCPAREIENHQEKKGNGTRMKPQASKRKEHEGTLIEGGARSKKQQKLLFTSMQQEVASTGEAEGQRRMSPLEAMLCVQSRLL